MERGLKSLRSQRFPWGSNALFSWMRRSFAGIPIPSQCMQFMEYRLGHRSVNGCRSGHAIVVPPRPAREPQFKIILGNGSRRGVELCLTGSQGQQSFAII
jgi:hypothetical protein